VAMPGSPASATQAKSSVRLNSSPPVHERPQRLFESVVDADELPQAQHERMRCERGIELVVRELETWEDEHSVQRGGAGGLCLELFEVAVEVSVQLAEQRLRPCPHASSVAAAIQRWGIQVATLR
jgi:hypothetical protein